MGRDDYAPLVIFLLAVVVVLLLTSCIERYPDLPPLPTTTTTGMGWFGAGNPSVMSDPTTVPDPNETPEERRERERREREERRQDQPPKSSS